MNYKNPSLPISKRVADLLGRMTLAEKVAQCVQFFVLPETRESIKQRIRQNGLGSRILTESNLAGALTLRIAEVEDLNEMQRVAVEETRLGIPLLYGRDVIHGHRTIFPIPLGMAATFDPSAVEQAFEIAAQEASAVGVHWSFAPMLDIARDARWGRIIEGFGEDPYLAAQLAAAAVHGFQGDLNPQGYYAKGRLMACAKHYIGYGAAEGGRDYNTAEISDNTLRNIYLPSYRAAVRAGVGSVMSAFEDLNGESASGSHYLLTELLKQELGFQGFIVSDWGSISDLITHRLAADEREAARLGMQAGVDMDMCSPCYPQYLADLVEKGEILIERLDDAVHRILTAKFQLGLFEHPYTPTPAQDEKLLHRHMAATRRTAARGMVLLHNNGVLPLTKDHQKIAVVGPFADHRRPLLGSWINDGVPGETATLFEAIKAACPQAEIWTAPSELNDEILDVAARADVVILAVGESNNRNGENSCVADLRLPAGQEDLIRAAGNLGKPLVLVVFSGRPLVLTDVIRHTDAILYAWHPGTMGAHAAADILFGEVNPSGRLPVTFLRHTGQVPFHYNAKSTGRWVSEYHDVPSKPLFPFGFGLSYTTYEYSDLQLPAEVAFGQPVQVSVAVSNTGSRVGEAVVQCYLQDCVSRTTRPVRELKGFQRVLLQPGETRRIKFRLGLEELSYYGPGSQWVCDPGDFKVWVGADSNATLEGKFTVR